jgi:effector-binding domain-containing protein
VSLRSAEEITMTSTGPTPYYLAAQRTEPEFFDASETPTVVRKFTDYPLSKMEEAMDGTFSVLFQALTAQGLRPVGPPFSLYEDMSGETATFEVGIPVDRPLPAPVSGPSGAVLEGSVLPGGPVAAISHVGSYDRLGDAWGAFLQAVAESGRASAAPFWEFYATEPSPEADPESMRTDLVTRVTG